MKIIDPKVEVEEFDPKRIMKHIERAMRNCYRTENLITDDSYKRLIAKAINSGHESVLEHEKITVKLTCDIGVYKDLTRHRTGIAFSIESTRYCNYSKDKFDNNIKFIKPLFYDDGDIDEYVDTEPILNCLRTKAWVDCMQNIEDTYLSMSKVDGTTPDMLRMILPHSTAADVYMTCNIREWRHIFQLRCSKAAHPAIRQLLIPLLLKFKYLMPELFDDIEYDKEFPTNKYAEVGILEE